MPSTFVIATNNLAMQERNLRRKKKYIQCSKPPPSHKSCKYKRNGNYGESNFHFPIKFSFMHNSIGLSSVDSVGYFNTTTTTNIRLTPVLLGPLPTCFIVWTDAMLQHPTNQPP